MRNEVVRCAGDGRKSSRFQKNFLGFLLICFWNSLLYVAVHRLPTIPFSDYFLSFSRVQARIFLEIAAQKYKGSTCVIYILSRVTLPQTVSLRYALVVLLALWMYLGVAVRDQLFDRGTWTVKHWFVLIIYHWIHPFRFCNSANCLIIVLLIVRCDDEWNFALLRSQVTRLLHIPHTAQSCCMHSHISWLHCISLSICTGLIVWI